MRWPSFFVAAAMVLGGWTLGATPASAAPLCALDTAAKRLNVTGQGSDVTIRAGSGYVLVNDAACATLTGIDTVGVDMASTSGRFTIDLNGGPLGPGATDEGNGSSEIEFQLSGLGDTTMAVKGLLSSPNALYVGTYLSAQFELLGHINLNALADAATRDVDVVMNGALPVVLYMSGGLYSDVISGAGAGGIGARPYSGRIDLYPGDGAYPDQLTGGSGSDFLATGPTGFLHDADTYFGGGGFDYLAIGVANSTGSAEFSLDDVANDGGRCPGANCESDNVHSDIEGFLGSEMSEHFVGSPLSSRILGGGGVDTIEGGGGADHLSGGPGDDFLVGGAGKDILEGDDGRDQLQGGSGLDTANYLSNVSGHTAVTVSMNGLSDDGEVGEHDNVISDVEKVIGSSFDDTFIGNAMPNVFVGGPGNDQFQGRGGDDTLLGQEGDDTFNGGPGSDRCAQGPGTGTKVGCES